MSEEGYLISEKIRERLEKLVEERNATQWAFARKRVEIDELEETIRRRQLSRKLLKLELGDLREALSQIGGAIKELEELYATH